MLNLLELLKQLVVWLVKDAVSRMAAFALISPIDFHVDSASIANLFNREFDPPNFENVFLLNLVVDLFVVVFEAAYDEVHVLVEVGKADGRLAREPHVFFILEVAGGAFEVEGGVVDVDDFQQGFVFRLLGQLVNLIFKGREAGEC